MKIINVVLGLGTAFILAALISLGIQAFYPEPVAPNYPNTPVVTPCASNDAQCAAQNEVIQQTQQNEFTEQQNAWQDQLNIYDRNLFIIANIIGIIVFAVGFFLLFATAIAAQSVPIGIMIAGLWGIIYGYARGWGGVDDQLKFFVGLIIAVLVIGGSMWLVQRYAIKRGK